MKIIPSDVGRKMNMYETPECLLYVEFTSFVQGNVFLKKNIHFIMFFSFSLSLHGNTKINSEKSKMTYRVLLGNSLIFSCMWMIFAVIYKDKCISSRNHKSFPGPEGKALASFHCTPWSDHSCCTWNTTKNIAKDGILSLYGMPLDQCIQKNMSQKCREWFHRDTCFYECSPNLGPWINEDNVSKKERKERIVGVPLCAKDCSDWYHACMDDFTCNDNWGKNWNWKKKGTKEICTKPCKLFKEYFPDPKAFCENIFNFSFKYETEETKCMNMVPKANRNKLISDKKAEELTKSGESRVRSFKKMCFTVSFVLFIHSI